MRRARLPCAIGVACPPFCLRCSLGLRRPFRGEWTWWGSEGQKRPGSARESASQYVKRMYGGGPMTAPARLDGARTRQKTMGMGVREQSAARHTQRRWFAQKRVFAHVAH